MTVDYFDISLEDGVGTVPAATSLDKCLETGIDAFCDNIHRHPVTGSLWLSGGYIDTQTTNITEESVKGIDIIFDYDFDSPFGPMGLEGVTTRVLESSFIELLANRSQSVSGTGVSRVVRIRNRIGAEITNCRWTQNTILEYL